MDFKEGMRPISYLDSAVLRAPIDKTPKFSLDPAGGAGGFRPRRTTKPAVAKNIAADPPKTPFADRENVESTPQNLDSAPGTVGPHRTIDLIGQLIGQGRATTRQRRGRSKDDAAVQLRWIETEGPQGVGFSNHAPRSVRVP